jgi:uncharacterized integral membrane protein
MNKLLAETLSFLNGLVALLSIIVGGVLGNYAGSHSVPFDAQLNAGTQSQADVGLIVGLVIGFLWAVVFHGLLALFIQMHRELKAIRQQLEVTHTPGSPVAQVRVEPRIPTLGA